MQKPPANQTFALTVSLSDSLYGLASINIINPRRSKVSSVHNVKYNIGTFVKPEVKKHLESLGFVAGGAVTVINIIGGNLIVNVKESRVAVSKEMAQKIMIFKRRNGNEHIETG